MDKLEKHARRRLDALLREAPDRIRLILEEGDLAATLDQLRQADAPCPEWVRDKARNIRFKCGCARAELGTLADELRGALDAWTEAGGEDAFRISQAELVLQQIGTKSDEMNAVRQHMKTLIAQTDIAEAGAQQADQMAALAQLRHFEKEARG